MRISELAEKLGISTDTIRYYEKRGLLNHRHMEREDNGYRRYNEKAIERIRLIFRAKTLGVTLAEMSQFIDEWESEAISVEDKRIFFNNKIALVDKRIDALNQMREYLCQKVIDLEKNE
ncbi:MAG: MerR family transcriptional regulator [Chloroflexota bacterium]